MTASLRAFLLVACVLHAPMASAARWALAHGAANDHLAGVLSSFAADVSAETRGALTIAPAAGRGVTARTVTGAQAAAAAIPLSELAASDPLLAVDLVPFLAANFVEARKLWSVLKPKLESSLSKRGLILLFAVVHPPKALLSNRALTRVQDFKGATVALDSAGLEPLVRLTGARGVRGDGASLLKSRKVDLAVVSSAEAVAGKAWDYARYYYHAPAWFPKHLVVANRNAVVGLGRIVRDGLLNASDRADAAAWGKAESETAERVQNLRDRGVKVRRPDVKFLIELEQLGRNLLFVWSDRAGEHGAQVVESYYAIK